MTRATKTKEAQADTLFGATAVPVAEAKTTRPEGQGKRRARTGGSTPPTAASTSREVATVRSPTILDAIIRAAADPACQPEKMHALLDARDRLMRQQAEVGYRRAFRAAKKHMPTITKDGKIDEGTTRSGRQGKKTRYATYENINSITGPILEDHGLDLSLRSEPKPGGEGIVMMATLSYIAMTEYGEVVYSESSSVPMPPDPTGSKNPAQAVSSALAYAKRNAVILVINLVSYAPQDRDLDGQAVASVPLVTAAEIKGLRKAIDDCGVGDEKFCKHYGIEKVEDLPAHQLLEALSSCAAFKAKREGQK